MTTLLPVPWEGGEVIDELDTARRCLERVGLDVLARSQSDQKDLVVNQKDLIVEILDLIQGKGLKANWKTAFRLMNAIRKPETEDGFVSQVFGQDEYLRSGIEPALKSTPLWDRLAFLAKAPKTT